MKIIPAFLISMISLFLSMLGANHLFEHMVVKLHLRWLKHSFIQLSGISINFQVTIDFSAF